MDELLKNLKRWLGIKVRPSRRITCTSEKITKNYTSNPTWQEQQRQVEKDLTMIDEKNTSSQKQSLGLTLNEPE
ncbi:hypothetical protein JCM14722_30120 [Pseudodesulfovibrio portus]|uniref:Transposase n=1 Tax=Pseudodesulfovibrio portus TaxID=231439 RepID=A0ABN6S170_9BACT|nr:hypothetical protein JCM14722_30120 [Pseudodesulfovibrio portus]